MLAARVGRNDELQVHDQEAGSEVHSLTSSGYIFANRKKCLARRISLHDSDVALSKPSERINFGLRSTTIAMCRVGAENM